MPLAYEGWILPEGVDELLPPTAERIEQLRRRLLDGLRSWGYELVQPPLVEYLESLLTGSGEDLETQTCKVVDERNGRLMGVRPDMTPQAARIDAHRLGRREPVRLCYAGQVLHSRPDTDAVSRSPYQLGAELFGHAGVEADLEVLLLCLETLAVAGWQQLVIDLGHVGVYRGLARQGGLSAEAERQLFRDLQRKAMPEVATRLAELDLPPSVARMLAQLASLHGPAADLPEFRKVLRPAAEPVQQALDELAVLVQGIAERRPEVGLHVDLAELRGYGYQTGAVFAVYAQGFSRELARGGRYDDIGRIFGRARPATGFSCDLQRLIAANGGERPPGRGILAPWPNDAALWEVIQGLRAQGDRVVLTLPGQIGGAAEMGCAHLLVRGESGWQVVEA